MTATILSRRFELDLERELATRSFRDFIAMAWEHVDPSPFVPNWHIDAIADHLEMCSRGEIRTLAINVPPGTAKSLLTSVMWQAWEWTWKPWTRWLTTAHRTPLATRDALRTRRLLDSGWYRERWGDKFDFAPDQNQKTRYENTRGGYRISYGVGGSTGERGDRLLCDDPHEIQGAESDTVRQNPIDWWDGTMSTRGNDIQTVVKVVIQQRVHQADLTGHLIETDPSLVLLKLPMRYEGVKAIGHGWTDPRTEEGELLFPERFPEAEVRTLEVRLQYRAAGQLQQRPTPKGGGMFKREAFEIVPTSAVPRTALLVRYWDIAATLDEPGKDPDFTAGVLIGWDIAVDDLYVIHVDRFRENPEEVEKRVAQRAALDGKRIMIRMEEEGGSAGKSLISHYRRNVLAGYRFEGHSPTGQKDVRAMVWAGMAATGSVKLVAGEWNEEFLAEAEVFPFGAHDDQIDGVSGGAAVVLKILEELEKRRKRPYGGAVGGDRSDLARYRPR